MLPMRGASTSPTLKPVASRISIHAPHAGSVKITPGRLRHITYFNPCSPCGERHLFYSRYARIVVLEFQSMLPMRGASKAKGGIRHDHRYFNPCSPCGERPTSDETKRSGATISIHAPHAGSVIRRPEIREYIALFQSMLPMRVASRLYCLFEQRQRTISIHAPHAGSVDQASVSGAAEHKISIHAPHAGSVEPGTPAGRNRVPISIHAPHAGSVNG